MPNRPKSPCSYPGCGQLVDSPGKCETHRRRVVKDKDMWRLTPDQRGYGYRWRKVRALYLKSNPLCVRCLDAGRTTAATVVDHIRAHQGDEALMWDDTNYQSLCKRCHDRKTVIEDGGFGRSRQP